MTAALAGNTLAITTQPIKTAHLCQSGRRTDASPGARVCIGGGLCLCVCWYWLAKYRNQTARLKPAAFARNREAQRDSRDRLENIRNMF